MPSRRPPLKARPTLRVVEGSAPEAKGKKARPAGLKGREGDKYLTYAHSVLSAEATAIASVTGQLGESFVAALELISSCTGQVVVTGMGKPGFIAQKLSATLASTGIRSIYLHPADAVHGDLGRVSKGDVVLALSNSGATEEILRLLPTLRRIGTRIVALTGDGKSPLARSADVVIDIGRIDEACPLGLVPTASSAALHAVGDALAMTLLKYGQFSSEEYAILHPGGKLGRSVMRVSDVMRQGPANPLASENASLSEVVVVMTNTPGRPGAANIVDAKGKLVGIFTDGDLRRLVEQGRTNFALPVKGFMGRNPKFVRPEELVLTAAARMREAAVDQLPVLDADGRAIGLLDVQDLLAARFV